MKDNSIISLVDNIYWTDRDTGGLSAVHAGHRKAPFTRPSFIDGNYPSSMHTPGDMVGIFASNCATITIDATGDIN
jgi:hypothetical protein